MIVKVQNETFRFSTYSMEIHSLHRHPLLSAYMYEARRLVREPSCVFKESVIARVALHI